MSFLKRLFGGVARNEASSPDAGEEHGRVEHEGFLIRATPFKAENGQFQTCGVVSREVGGVLKEHRFIRADRFASADAAAAFALDKGRQIVDQQGERMFD